MTTEPYRLILKIENLISSKNQKTKLHSVQTEGSNE